MPAFVLESLGWYLAVQLLSAVGLAWVPVVFRRSPGSGIFVHKILAFVAVGFASWFGWSLGIPLNRGLGVLATALALIVLAAALSRGSDRTRRFGIFSALNAHRRELALSEAVFALGFLSGIMLRLLDPAIDHTEEPMDLLLLSAVLVSDSFPPQDPWLAGYPIAYYYLGYWLQALPARWVGAVPELAYNLAQATWLGMLAAGSFGLVHELVRRAGAARGRAVAAGLLAIASVALTSNVAGIASVYGRRASGDPGWWWWSSSRVIHDTRLDGERVELITEFPAFSYVLGDNHPHVLATPVLLLVLALALELYRRFRARLDGRESPVSAVIACLGDGHRPAAAVCVAVAAVASGALLALNPWDLPISLAALLLLPLLAAVRTGAGLRRSLQISSLAMLVIAVWIPLLYAPFLVTAQSQQRGLVPNLFFPTELAELGLVFGVFAPALLALLLHPRPPLRGVLYAWGGLAAVAFVILAIGAGWASWTPAGRGWLGDLGADAPVQAWLVRRASGLGTLAATTALLALALMRGWRFDHRSRATDTTESDHFAVAVAALGLLPIFVSELVFVRDLFGTRMNTVFKLFYESWLLLALASAFAIGAPGRSGTAWRALRFLTLLLVAFGLPYTVLAAASKARSAPIGMTLDGLAHLDRTSPGERAAIAWIRREVEPDAIVLQAPGDSFHPQHSRISAATGRPTLIGWRGHELQWRGADYPAMAADREEAASAIYASDSVEEVARWMDRFGIRYVAIGPPARERFGPDAGRSLAEISEILFEAEDWSIVRRSPPAPR